MFTIRHSYAKRNRGYILITVLLFVSLLTALLVHANIACRTAQRSAASFAVRHQALNLAHSGLNIAHSLIQKNPDPLANTALFALLHETKTITLNAGHCRLRIAAENGKINLNQLRLVNGSYNPQRIGQLERLIRLLNDEYSDRFSDVNALPALPPEIIPAIIDWTDRDDEITLLSFLNHPLRGAEEDYYQNLSPARHCRNNPLTTLDECYLIRGMSPQWLYDQSRHDESSSIIGPFSDCVTIYGDGKIDINAAPVGVIQSLSENMTETMAEQIIDRRRQTPFKTLADLYRLPGLSALEQNDLGALLTTRPTDRYYTVKSVGIANGVETAIIAVIRANSTSANADIIQYKEL